MQNLDLKKIGQNVKYYREKIKSISQVDLTSDINISLRALSNIENGKTDFSISRLSSICIALNVSVIALISDEQNAKSILNNFYNHDGNKGINIQYQNQLEEYRKVYDLLITSKNEQIELLTELVNKFCGKH